MFQHGLNIGHVSARTENAQLMNKSSASGLLVSVHDPNRSGNLQRPGTSKCDESPSEHLLPHMQGAKDNGYRSQ